MMEELQDFLLGGFEAGTKPIGPDGVAQPWAYASGDATGVSMGAGLINGPHQETGDPTSAVWLNGGAGAWTDPVTGLQNYGIAADGGIAKVGEELGDGPMGLGWDVGFATASANASHNENTTGVGVAANLLEASATMGDPSDSLRFGASLGAGGGARVHHGDQDGDGVRELGFGFDAGPISMDIKSEMLGECWNMFQDPEVDLPGPFW